MIQTQELRKGNKIIANGLHGGRIMTVDRLADKGTLSEENRPVMFEEHEIGEFLKDCEGIPLSPDILQAAGFEKDDHDFWHFGKLSIVMPGFAGYPDGRLYFNSWMIMEPPKYLHLLMNIHFFLTGTELNINLEKVKV